MTKLPHLPIDVGFILLAHLSPQTPCELNVYTVAASKVETNPLQGLVDAARHDHLWKKFYQKEDLSAFCHASLHSAFAVNRAIGEASRARLRLDIPSMEAALSGATSLATKSGVGMPNLDKFVKEAYASAVDQALQELKNTDPKLAFAGVTSCVLNVREYAEKACRFLPPIDALERNYFAVAAKDALRKMRKTAHSGDGEAMNDLLTQAQSYAKKANVRLPDTRDLQQRVCAEAAARATPSTTRLPAEDWLSILDGTSKMDLNKPT